MTATTYVALLRGINVGGKNLIKMADLSACFESNGFEDVRTYIQSGNVLFRSDVGNVSKLTSDIGEMLSSRFGYTATLVLRSQRQMRAVVENAPSGFGTGPDVYRYDVIFLMPPLTAGQALDKLTLKEGVDVAHAGRGVLYFSRLTERATQSRLSKIVSSPIYPRLTIRNWNTTTKLLALMDADG